MSKMDWKKESEGNFPVYPTGTYKVQISSVKRTVSKNKNTPGITWISTVVSPEDYTGRGLSVTTWTNDSSLWRVARLVEACGITGVPNVDTESEAFLDICKSCIGRTLYWRNEQREYEGNPQNNVVDFQPDPDQATTEFVQDAGVPDWAKG